MINYGKCFIFLFALVFHTEVQSSDLWHPGSGDFLEIGMVKNYSAFGYQVYSPYVVPRFTFGNFELMQSHINYYVLNTSAIKLGPGLNFAFPIYAGTETDSLKGMSRGPYFEGLAVAQIALPFGQLEIVPRYPLYSGEREIDWKANFATGIPAFKIGSNRSWVNLQYEFTLLSPQTSSYIFGVKAAESTPTRPAYQLGYLPCHSLVTSYWIPISKRFWITTTMKKDWYPANILGSPIVQKNSETTYLIGILYSFTGGD